MRAGNFIFREDLSFSTPASVVILAFTFRLPAEVLIVVRRSETALVT